MNKIPQDVKDEFLQLVKDGIKVKNASNYIGISAGYGYYLADPEKYGRQHREYIERNREKVYAKNKEYHKKYYQRLKKKSRI